MKRPRIYADFKIYNSEGNLLLTAQGSLRDIKMLTEAKDGQLVIFYSDDENDKGEPDELEVEGSLIFDNTCGNWIGVYDPNGFRHASDSV